MPLPPCCGLDELRDALGWAWRLLQLVSRPALSEKGVDQEGACVGWQDARFDQDQVGAGSVSKKMTSWGSGEPLNAYPGCLGHFTPFWVFLPPGLVSTSVLQQTWVPSLSRRLDPRLYSFL